MSVDPRNTGGRDAHGNGNGALMRSLPVVLCYPTVFDELRDGAAHSLLAFCSASPDHLAHVEELEPHVEELEFRVRPRITGGSGSGYVVDSLRPARHCIETTDNYANALRIDFVKIDTVKIDSIKAAIALGHDTGTTICAVRNGLSLWPSVC